MMKNLVRGGFILSLIGTFVLFIYASDRTGGDLSIANNSQVQLDQILENTKQTTNDEKDKKLVKKTVLESPAAPAEARAALTSLMTRLILDHAVTTATPRAKEVDHDL